MQKWEVGGAAIGTVTDSGRMRVLARRASCSATCRCGALVDDCPLYDLAPAKPPERDLPAPARRALARERQPRETLLALLASPNLASRRPLFEQYDCDRAVAHGAPPRAGRRGGAGAARRQRAGGLSIDGNGRRVAADPYRGTIAAVLECAANLACAGAEPLGTTNNLNFGNPEKPHIAWQLSESVRGLGDACRALRRRSSGGNVSLYNEGAAGPIYPTPVIGMVGRLPDARRAGRAGLPRRGRADRARRALRARRWRRASWHKLHGEPLPDGLPEIDLAGRGRDAWRGARGGARRLASQAPTTSPRAASPLLLAECCLAGGLGARVVLLGEPWGATFARLGRGRASGGRSHRPWPRCSARARAAF